MPGVYYVSKGDPKGIRLLKAILKGSKTTPPSEEAPRRSSLEAPISSGVEESHLLQLHTRLGDKSLDYEQRAQTAVEVLQVLKKFEANCIPALWYSAHDLIGPKVPQTTRKCALELLDGCISECRDVAVKEVFFRIVMAILAKSSGAEKKILDPHVALILSCLRHLLDGMSGLEDGDASFLKDAVEEIIDVSARGESSFDGKMVQEILLIVPLLNELIRYDSLLNLLDMLCSILKQPAPAGPCISSEVLNFIIYLLQSHEQQLNSPVFNRLIVILNRLADGPNFEKNMKMVKDVMNQIAQSSHNSAFLEDLLSMSVIKIADCDQVLKLYPLIFADRLCHWSEAPEGFTTKDQINHLLDTLNALKMDQETLKIMTLLLRSCQEQKQSDLAQDVVEQGHLWSLVKASLVGNTDNDTLQGFVQSVLDIISTTKLKVFAVSLDDLIRFFLTLQISDLDIRIMKLVNIRRADVRKFETLDVIGSRALLPSVLPSIRVELYNLLIVLARDSCFKPLKSPMNQFAIVLKTYNRSKSHDMGAEELLLFENFLYQYLRILHIKYFHSLITEHIVPDIQAILMQSKRRKSIVNTLGNFGRSKQPNERNLQRAEYLVRSCVKTFIWSATDTTGSKCILLFSMLCSVYSASEKYHYSPVSLTIARAMIRIRKSVEGHFYFTVPTDAVGISASVGRLREAMPLLDENHKWTFPESVEYIEESLLGEQNKSIGFTENDKDQGMNINIGDWLSLAISSIKAPTDWEIHSYLLAHLCSQLSETSLLLGQFKLIESFKDVICDHLTRTTPLPIDLGEGVSHSDLHSAYVRNLSSVLAYHPFQQKKFADELISALVVGLKSWEKTLIPILHILSVSCFEVPLSVQKCLSQLLPQIQMRMTNTYAIPSVLEFLLALRNSPRVISNLTIDEVKRVFGIVFKLIENSVDLRVRSRIEGQRDGPLEYKNLHPHNQDYAIEVSPSTESFSMKESMVLFLQCQSFEVLTSWFCSLSADRLKELQPFVTANLRKLEKVEGLKYDALAHIDFVLRSEFIKQPHWNMSGEAEEGADRMRWVGTSTLISIGSTNNGALVKVWKPTCTYSFEYRPRIGPFQPTYNLFGFDRQKDPEMTSADEKWSPAAVLSQLSYSLETSDISQERFIPVPDDVSFDRSVSMLDRLPNKEFLKIGIIYIDKNQDTEAQVLSNTSGSYQYHWFLDQMGQFVKLSEKPKLLYAGGLDDGTDGEFALMWSDEISRIAFHTTTLMPNSADLSSKKRHVGNNFVNIFYNESGLPNFNFNIIKSQFTFISIVITPQEAAVDQKIAQHYKIKLYRRTGTPGLFSCAHFKILTRSNLARYVRHVSQIANALAEKTHHRHPPDACSAWGAKYRHLKMIRDRVTDRSNATDLNKSHQLQS